MNRNITHCSMNSLNLIDQLWCRIHYKMFYAKHSSNSKRGTILIRDQRIGQSPIHIKEHTVASSLMKERLVWIITCLVVRAH